MYEVGENPLNGNIQLLNLNLFKLIEDMISTYIEKCSSSLENGTDVANLSEDTETWDF